MSLTPATYTQTEVTGGNAETGWGDTAANSKTGGPYFQDCVIAPSSVGDGTLRQRFDLLAFPRVGHKATGTNGHSGDNTVPAAAKTVY